MKSKVGNKFDVNVRPARSGTRQEETSQLGLFRYDLLETISDLLQILLFVHSVNNFRSKQDYIRSQNHAWTPSVIASQYTQKMLDTIIANNPIVNSYSSLYKSAQLGSCYSSGSDSDWSQCRSLAVLQKLLVKPKHPQLSLL